MIPCYTIHDLSRESGFSVRVIRKYISTGLVPKAVVGKGLAARSSEWGERYTNDHLDVLFQIRDIQENNMTLADIHDRLNPYTGDDDDE